MKKKKNVNKDEEMENYFDVFLRNYRNVPGFRSLIKLLIYFFLIGIFIIVVAFANGDTNSNEESKTTTTTTQVLKSDKTYKEILETVYKNDSKFKITAAINSENYVIDASNINNEVIGYFESNEETKRFKISNSKIYELKLDNEIENNKLFKEIELDFIIPANLINILENNLSTKRITNEYTVYTYDIDYNEKDYKINTYILEEKLIKIEIANEEYNYIINYE